jgi:tRNA threonylcarbamoyladenosine biosynthesis protein TsaB
MLLLGLDTATLTLTAALVLREGGEDRLLARADVPPPTPHSDLLPRLLGELLAGAGRSPGDLGGVVVGLGPGSFTGLRIGLATAKGLCYASRIPLAGASSLAAMALAAAPDAADGELLVPCLDARKGEVYCGLFRRRGGGVELEGREMALGPEALAARLSGERAQVFGIGREAYPPLQALPSPATRVRTPDALALVRLARQLPPFDKQAVFALEPHYVRPSDSEWTLKAKKPRPGHR